MKLVTIEEYRTREKIILENAIVNENKIYVTSDSTCYINLEKVEKIDIKGLLELYKEIIKIAKEKKVSISYKNGYKKKLIELEHSYNVAYSDYEESFNDLVWLWKLQLEQGIRVGYRDDVLYYKAILPIKFKIEKMFNRDQVMSIIKEIKYSLEKTKDDLTKDEMFGVVTKIFI